jgi:hypothetical protein
MTSQAVVKDFTVLRTLSGLTVPSVFAEGSVTPGDGGGGAFYYNSADTSSPDNNGTIIVATNGGSTYRYYRIYDDLHLNYFLGSGARDGTTDNTAGFITAVNVAMASSRKLLLDGGPITLNGQTSGGTPIAVLLTSAAAISNSNTLTLTSGSGLAIGQSVIDNGVTYNLTPTAAVTNGIVLTFSSTTGVAPFQIVSGTGIPSGTRVASVTSTTVTLTSVVSVGTENAISFSDRGITTLVTNSSSSGTTLNFASTTGVGVGMDVAGVSIPAGTTVESVGATSITLSQSVSATIATGTPISFYNPGSITVTAISGDTVTLSGNMTVASGATVAFYNMPSLSNISLIGVEVDSIYEGTTQYGGTSFVIIDSSGPVFSLVTNVTIDGCVFYYPDQTEANYNTETGSPMIYPPLITNQWGNKMGAITIKNCRFTNPFDLFVVDAPGGSYGDIFIDSCRGWAVRDYFRFSTGTEVMLISNCLWSIESYGSELNGLTTHNLRNWHIAYSSFQHIVASSSQNAPGAFCSDSYLLGMNTVTRVDLGTVSIPGNTGWVKYSDCGFDGLPCMLSVGQYAGLETTLFSGCTIFQYNYELGAGVRLDSFVRPSDGATISQPIIFCDLGSRVELTVNTLDCDIVDGVVANVFAPNSLDQQMEFGGIFVKAFQGESSHPVLMTINASSTLTGTQSVVAIKNCKFQSIASGGGNWIGVSISNDPGMVHLVGNTFLQPAVAVDLTSASTSLAIGAFSNYSLGSTVEGLRNPSGITVEGSTTSSQTNYWG